MNFPYGLRYVRITPFKGWLEEKMFRWQWALVYEYADNTTGEWEEKRAIFESREDARIFRKMMGNATCFRNWSMKRRRVQRKWEHVRNLKGWTDRDEL